MDDKDQQNNNYQKPTAGYQLHGGIRFTTRRHIMAAVAILQINSNHYVSNRKTANINAEKHVQFKLGLWAVIT